MEQNIMLQIEDTVRLAQTNFERVGATKEARQFAEAALQAEQTKLENGKSTSFLRASTSTRLDCGPFGGNPGFGGLQQGAGATRIAGRKRLREEQPEPEGQVGS
jgi:hypothetical protein